MAKIAIHIITGFLGSGKTTFLQEFLEQEGGKNIALIVNELGEVALDNELIQTQFVKETLVLNAGCMCCNKREDLSQKCKEVLDGYEKSGKKLERILIETTGLANPAPIVFTLLSDAFLANHFYLANIITCVDALDGLKHLEQNAEARSQIISADYVVITKTDLHKDTQKLREKIFCIHQGVGIVAKEDFNFNKLFSLKRMEEFSGQKFLQNSTPTNLHQAHQNSVNSLCLCFDKPLDWSVFGIWLSMLLYTYGDKILRVKGLLDVDEDYLVNINGVGHIIYPPTHTKISSRRDLDIRQDLRIKQSPALSGGKDESGLTDQNKTYLARQSRLVFIAKNLDLKNVEYSLRAFLKLKI